MRLLILLVLGFCLVSGGCKSDDKALVQKDLDASRTRAQNLMKEIEALQMALRDYKMANEAQAKRVDPLEKQVADLTQQLQAERAAATREIAQLRNQLGAATRTADTLAGMVSTESSKPRATNSKPAAATVAASGGRATTAAGANDTSTAELEKTIADLDSRIKTLQPKVGLARSKVSILVRATVDQQMVPPVGGYIDHGKVHNRDGAIGPAVKPGDYRTQRDKEDAIRAAKEETLPMEQELKSLQDELAAAKAKLAKLRTAQPGG